ncbi:hypothetical protein J25TS5_44900 [Paenibacillus faecis]|nr:hypothetical protein J25TS5_44900 [Paenibacillus faecis]
MESALGTLIAEAPNDLDIYGRENVPSIPSTTKSDGALVLSRVGRNAFDIRGRLHYYYTHRGMFDPEMEGFRWKLIRKI